MFLVLVNYNNPNNGGKNPCHLMTAYLIIMLTWSQKATEIELSE